MNIINKVFGRFMKKQPDYQKETYRGTIKQIMKVRGIRTISLANYNKYLGIDSPHGVHSIKLDLQDGYMNIYGYNTNGRCGEVIDNASSELYEKVYNQVRDIMSNEHEIPGDKRRNILVRLCR